MNKSQVEFKFDIQNTENIHDKGNLNTQAGLQRGAEGQVAARMGGIAEIHQDSQDRPLTTFQKVLKDGEQAHPPPGEHAGAAMHRTCATEEAPILDRQSREPHLPDMRSGRRVCPPFLI